MLFAYFVILLFKSCLSEHYVEPKMIADLLKTMDRPAYLILTSVCWTLRERVRLYKSVAGDNVPAVTMMRYLELSKISTLQLQDEQHAVFLLDLSCLDYEQHIDLNQRYFNSPFRWIIIESNNTRDSVIPKAIDNIDLLPDSEVTVVQRGLHEAYEFNSIYKISANSTWKKEYYGSWNMESGFQKSLHSTNPVALRRIDLNGYEIKICYVLTDSDSINHLDDEVNDHIDTITKASFPTTNYLIDFLRARRKYVFVDTWGYNVNGTWNGMTGYLFRGEVDIGGSPMFFTTERIPIVEYITSPTPTRSKFVFQQPKLSYENNLFILSFRPTVWYSSVALISLLFLALFMVAIWEWKKTKNTLETREKDASILRGNVPDVIILIFAAVCQQGSPSELKGSLGRVVMLILFLALMFLYTSYSANIVALLQSSSSKIKSLDDLLHSRLKFGVHDTVFNRYYFSHTSEPVRKAIYEKKIAPPGTSPRFMTMEEGVKAMQKGLFAFHMETGVGYKFVGKFFNEGEKCGLKEIQYLQVIDPWLAVKKNTPYIEMFKIGFKRIQEHGLQNRENRIFYAKRPTCSTSKFVSVSMVDCYPALLILFYGSILALAILAIEIITHRRQNVLMNINCLSKKKTLDIDENYL